MSKQHEQHPGDRSDIFLSDDDMNSKLDAMEAISIIVDRDTTLTHPVCPCMRLLGRKCCV